MIPFSVTILGSSSAVPTKNRYQTSQLLQVNGHYYIIDAGENVQQRLLHHTFKPSKLNAIFISHLHPDHFIGLIGLLCTLGLQGRTKTLHIAGPDGLKTIINAQLKASSITLPFALVFIKPSENNEIIYQDKHLLVQSFSQLHRTLCYGYIFQKIKASRHLDVEACRKNDVPVEAYSTLQQARDFETEEGHVFAWQSFTIPATPPRKYAFCTDTRPLEQNLPFIKHVEVLYHDATFLHHLQNKAVDTYHSTCIEAAEMAKKAQVQSLILGHFSSRYDDLTPLLQEAKQVFPKSFLGIEDYTFTIE